MQYLCLTYKATKIHINPIHFLRVLQAVHILTAVLATPTRAVILLKPKLDEWLQLLYVSVLNYTNYMCPSSCVHYFATIYLILELCIGQIIMEKMGSISLYIV